MTNTNLLRHQFLQNRYFYFFPRKPIVSKDKHTRWKETAKKLNLSREARNRLEWFIWHETHPGSNGKPNASKTSRHFGIARKTFWKWNGRFKEDNLRTLEDESKTPKQKRQRAITPQQEAHVVALRKKYIKYSPQKLVRKYKEAHEETISAWKIQYTIEKYKLYWLSEKNRRTQKKRKNGLKKKRITELLKLPFPGFLLQLDTVVIYWNGTKRYIMTAIDRYSRVAFARMYSSPSSLNAADFLLRLWYLWGKHIVNLLTDNGSEFAKYFEKACGILKIVHYFTRVKTPKDNAHSERFNRTIQEEFISLGNFTTDVALFNRALTEWLIEYNYGRPHYALHLMTPMEFLQKFIQNHLQNQTSDLLPMYSYCTET